MKKNIIKLLTKFKNLYLLENDAHRTNAYSNAVKSIHQIKKVPITMSELIKLKGIGKGIAEKIIEYIQDGKVQKLKDLEQKHIYIARLTSISGIGPYYAKKFVSLGITSIVALKRADKLGKIKLTRAQQLCIAHRNDLKQKIPRKEIDKFNVILSNAFKTINPYLKYMIAGSYRRGKKLSGDIDVVIWSSIGHANQYIDQILNKLPQYIAPISQGTKKLSGLFRIDKYVRRVDLLFTHCDSRWAAINYFTGSKETNIMIRSRAKELGYVVNEHCLKKGNKIITIPNEQSLYKILKLKYIKPIDR
jgi:DNA polymerase/3'-5' exonuclease PolX